MFLSQDPVLSYITLDSIKSDLTQFTFTAWFKFSVGLKKYHLMSYKTSDQIDVFNAEFQADYKSVDKFVGAILQCNEP